MKKDLADEVKELNKRIIELEKMISVLIKPLKDIRKTTSNYMRLTGLLLDHGGLTPDLILPEIKDPISKEIVRVLMDRKDQNISQITELIRNKRGTIMNANFFIFAPHCKMADKRFEPETPGQVTPLDEFFRCRQCPVQFNLSFGSRVWQPFSRRLLRKRFRT